MRKYQISWKSSSCNLSDRQSENYGRFSKFFERAQIGLWR